MAFHTFLLPEKKTLKTVVRGVPTEVSEPDIMAELQALNFPVLQVRRMKVGTDKRPIPLVMVELEKNEDGKNIYDLTHIFYLKVRESEEETLRRTGKVSQCHRCQQFGHASNCCRAPPKCVKCAGDHLTSTCKHNKTKDVQNTKIKL